VNSSSHHHHHHHHHQLTHHITSHHITSPLATIPPTHANKPDPCYWLLSKLKTTASFHSAILSFSVPFYAVPFAFPYPYRFLPKAAPPPNPVPRSVAVTHPSHLHASKGSSKAVPLTNHLFRSCQKKVFRWVVGRVKWEDGGANANTLADNEISHHIFLPHEGSRPLI
jgi:hypothetical protein